MQYQRAAQPDIIRAVQKDETYLQQTVDATFELLRDTFGPAFAVRWAREVKLAAQLAYFATTTAAGTQTLGEEYCDILQASTAGGLPATRRRLTLVALQTLVPYLAERAASGLDSTHSAAGASDWRLDLEVEPDAGGPPGAAGTGAGGAAGEPSTSGRPPAGAAESWRELQGSLRRVMRQHWPAMRAAVAHAGRLNLALFYLFGAYYQLSKRLAGVQYHSIRAPGAAHPSYRLLGVLLLAQLATSLSARLLPLLPTPLGLRPDPLTPATLLPDHPEPPKPPPLPPTPTPPAHATPSTSALLHWPTSQPQPTLAPAPTPTPTLAANQHIGEPVLVTAGRQCPLCLSPRDRPTSTPCGHVFCWGCVTQWCAEKPECPLCRARVLPQQLVPTFHADL